MSLRSITRVAIALTTLGAADGWSGVLRGRLDASPMPAQAARPNAYPGVTSALPVSHAAARGEVTDAVLYYERIPAAAESTLARRSSRPQLAQRGQAFAPRVLAVAVGTTVDFPNEDPIYHNVFSVSPVKRFDLGKYGRGESRRVTFPKPGTVNVYCDIHSDMASTILVLPHHGFTQPDAEGRFAMPDVPGGHYLLKVWHPDRPELKKEVDVPVRGEARVEIGY